MIWHMPSPSWWWHWLVWTGHQNRGQLTSDHELSTPPHGILPCSNMGGLLGRGCSKLNGLLHIRMRMQAMCGVVMYFGVSSPQCLLQSLTWIQYWSGGGSQTKHHTYIAILESHRPLETLVRLHVCWWWPSLLTQWHLEILFLQDVRTYDN